MRYLIGIIIAAAIAVLSVQAYANQPVRYYEPVRIEVVAEDGSRLLTIPYKDFRNGLTLTQKRFLEARKGQNYGIVVRNMTPERIGVVIAVDGRNIISGKQSELKNSEQMYVIEANGSARLDGWRTNDTTVHKFYFTDVADSYSSRTFRDTSAMGVIAMAAYQEKERPRPVYRPYRSEHAPAAAMEKSSRAKTGAVMEDKAGTGFGEAQYAPVEHVSFEPQAEPLVKTLIKYEWREVLCKKGIISCGGEPGNRLWDESSYAPYPPGYHVR